MSRWLVVPVALPLAAAALAALAPDRIVIQRILGFGASIGTLAFAIALVAATADGSVLATQVGGFPAGFAIPFVADGFAALMLGVGSLMVVVCTAFATAHREDTRPFFHPLVLVLAAGVFGAFLTGDLFNLFVFFEVMLIASYVLATQGGSRERTRAAAIYVTTNLTASTVLIAGVGLTYAAAGTVNIAALSEAARTPALTIAGGVLLTALAVKASLVPVHGWLPRAYPAAPQAVSALFSGLLSKVGVYAIYRVYTVVFDGTADFRPLLLTIACATMVVGVLGAVGRNGMREILAFHMVSQVGYLILALGIFGVFGLTAGIFYMVQYIVVKTSLFLSAGAVETLEGTGDLDRLGGLARSHPVIATAFIVSALSLAGIPPLSGFVAKLLVVRSAFETTHYLVAAIAIGVGLLTLTSMVKIWNGVFWGETAGDAVVVGRGRAAALVAPGLLLAAISVTLGIFAGELIRLATSAAEGLVDPAAYIKAVLG